MMKTPFGNFDGNYWEQVCQICFKIKYAKEQYVEIKASPGDFGIEGFTRTGKVFQCYCPEKNYTQDELYEKQRNKITTDLAKIEKYQTQIVSRIGSTKIKEWHFFTPMIFKNEISKHCETKAKEYRKKKLSHLDRKFTVLPRDIEFLLPELSIALGKNSTELSLYSKVDDIDESIKVYKESDSDLVANALKKHQSRLSSRVVTEAVIDKFTDNTIQRFLDGASVISSWKDLIPEDYEKFQRITSLYERRVEEKCHLYVGDPNALLDTLRNELEDQIKSNFGNLDGATVLTLTDYVVADWILRCPINFL